MGEKEFIYSRIRQTKEKLNLMCPFENLTNDLEISKHRNLEFFNDMKKSILRVKRGNSLEMKDEEELVESLIMMSTSKPLLMRMWIGWLSFI
jgi:hypothetical protein